MRDPLISDYSWGVPEPSQIPGAALRWACGFCGHAAATQLAYYPKFKGTDNKGHGEVISIRICGNCQRPTYFEDGQPNSPSTRLGEDIAHLPTDVRALYDETRDATAAGAYTAAVLTCRKLLMHIAVEKGAEEGVRFIEYVEYLVNNHYAPKGSEGWVDYIRTRGNEATHEIEIMAQDDAAAIITLTAQLLRNIYELPASVPLTEESPTPPEVEEITPADPATS